MLQNAGGYTIRRHRPAILQALMEYGADVRILLSDPNDSIWDNPAIGKILAPDRGDGQTIRDLINGSIAEIKRIVEEMQRPTTPNRGVRRGALTVKLFQGLSPSNVVIINQKLVRQTPRVMYCHTEESPLIDIAEERGPLFAFYKKAFDDA
jgi:hypothetical protein